MIKKFIKKMFGNQAEHKESQTIATERYQDFEIKAAPVNEANGWRVAGTISKQIEGDLKEHIFVRADSCSDQQTAAALTLRKARQLIDEQGEKIF